MTDLKCKECGNVRKGVSKENVEKYVKIFGTKEKMLAGYVCRKCKKKLKVKVKKESKK